MRGLTQQSIAHLAPLLYYHSHEGSCAETVRELAGQDALRYGLEKSLATTDRCGYIPELDRRSAGFNPQNCPCVLARASSQPMPSGLLCSCGLKSALLHRQLVDARQLDRCREFLWNRSFGSSQFPQGAEDATHRVMQRHQFSVTEPASPRHQ